MDAVHSLLVAATQKLLELHRDPKWAVQLPLRCPPVLWFGNASAQKCKAFTFAANPSRKEFLSDSAEMAIEKVRRSGDQSSLDYLEPPESRFRVLKTSECLADILTSELLREEIITNYNSYFDRKPYTSWFGHNRDNSYNVEGFLRGFGASYYESEAHSLHAVHIDLLPFVTLQDFGKLKDMVDTAFFTNDWAKEFLGRLVEALSPTILILFGRTNCEYFAEHIDPSIRNMEWVTFGSGKYFLGHSLQFGLPVVGISTNLGNPKGFDRDGLRGFGRAVRNAVRI